MVGISETFEDQASLSLCTKLYNLPQLKWWWGYLILSHLRACWLISFLMLWTISSVSLVSGCSSCTITNFSSVTLSANYSTAFISVESFADLASSYVPPTSAASLHHIQLIRQKYCVSFCDKSPCGFSTKFLLTPERLSSFGCLPCASIFIPPELTSFFPL